MKIKVKHTVTLTQSDVHRLVYKAHELGYSYIPKNKKEGTTKKKEPSILTKKYARNVIGQMVKEHGTNSLSPDTVVITGTDSRD